MRLLHTKLLEVQTFISAAVPDYAILSHRWGGEELTLKDLVDDPVSDPRSKARNLSGFSKVQGACNQAINDGYNWIWIDSCCIDRSSSSELQEAINSMWNYYAQSNICYVYMVDVPDRSAGQDHRFNQSEWFTRGWTLQELIAPNYVEFYAADWSPLCTKLERYKDIAEITNIDPDILVRNQHVDAFSAAERLSWAAHRMVTREEDVAYSLLGLFQVNMPMLYGEGRERAFVRLQEAIYNSTHDHTLFLFRYSLHQTELPLLADSPTRFCPRNECSHCSPCSTKSLPPTISYTKIVARSIWSVQAHEQIMTTVTTYRNEASAKLELLDYNEVSSVVKYLDECQPRESVSHVAVLNCTLEGHGDSALCLLLFQPLNTSGDWFYRINSCPVLLPRIMDFLGRLQKRKILVCPEAIFTDRNLLVDTTFITKSTFAQSWTAKYVSQKRSDHFPEKTTKFSIQTTKFENQKHRAEVSNLITVSKSPSSRVSLRLIQFEETWSIKEVFEMTFKKRWRKTGTKFSSSSFSDRCHFRLSSGKMLNIGLRRLAACSRPESSNLAPKLRYEVFVEME
ncbi:hypothetical protein ACEPPN_009173 [Leptodophora sp. 'Broadleaf-Isolate-01']